MVIKKFGNGDKYDGDMEDGEKNGEGTLYYADGGNYAGEWSNDMRNGQGVNTWANGTIYDGSWKDNKKDGQGKISYPNGGNYVGEWEDDVRSGQGVNTWANGNRYKGSWSENKQNGQGTFTYPNGGKYVGEWEDNMRSGDGVNKWRNGNQYDGAWERNVQHGQGTFVYADGGKYEGEWAEDMRNGYGINSWPDGDRYEGEWEENKKHGQGTFYHADGTEDAGEWIDNELNGKKSLTTRKSITKADNVKSASKNLVKINFSWINGHPVMVLLMPKSSCCPYLGLAREYLLSLKWDKNFFVPSYDRCYCNHCYKDSWKNIIQAGEGNYVIPRGWVRLGLQIDPVVMQTQDIWNKWIVTFHGTTKVAAASIIEHRQFCMPGDVLIDGTKLRIRPGHIPGQLFVYTSPTIAYSSGPAYSPLYDFRSTENNTDYHAQIVLQCRQKPNSFEIGPETIGAGKTVLCPHIPNSEIEYFTDRRATLHAYGLLVRFRPKNT